MENKESRLVQKYLIGLRVHRIWQRARDYYTLYIYPHITRKLNTTLKLTPITLSFSLSSLVPADCMWQSSSKYYEIRMKYIA